MGKNEELENQFIESAEQIKQCGKTFDNETLLKLYGYFKQSTVGDCDIECPSFFQLKEKAKWDAWNNHKGMKKSHAMKKYIGLVRDLL
jgi:diazepam-binding inhibitor (GABA receptor modulating acyl-CoA-binding protein)